MDEKVILVLTQFILFTLVEGAIYAMFYNKWCKCNKFKLYHILLMCVGNYIIATTLPPLVYQGIMVIWMWLCICLVQKKPKFKYILYPLIGMLGVMGIEIIYNVLLETFSTINLLNIIVTGNTNNIDNLLYLFAFLLPTKFLEIFIIKRWDKIMKSWVGEIVRK